jgi:hypothetical protein
MEEIDQLINEAGLRLELAIESQEQLEVIEFLKQDLEDLKSRKEAYGNGRTNENEIR